METRNQIFQALKPPCVSLSQAALKLATRNGDSKEVISCLSDLLKTLRAITDRNGVLDEKLAEYVFFPLSHVLKASQKLPVRGLELSLDCLAVLLRTGWRSSLAPDLGGQLLILLTYLASQPSGGSKIANTSEELQAVAFTCLSELFRSLSTSEIGRASLTSTASIPSLGHSVTTMLEGIQNGPSRDVQLAAVGALDSLFLAIGERDVLASFLPGIVSALTRVLTPSTLARRHSHVLAGSLRLLSKLFNAVVSDQQTESLPESVATDSDRPRSSIQLTQSWLKATASQLNVALASIIKLRQHDRIEVRRALLGLCTTVLQKCRRSLSESANLMLGTMVILASGEADEGNYSVLEHTVAADESLLELLKSSVHTWVVSLPRLIQSRNDTTKRRAISQISTAIHLLTQQGADLTVINHTIVSSLCDTVLNILQESKAGVAVAESSPQQVLSLSGRPTPSIQYSPLIVGPGDQEDTITELRQLLEQLTRSDGSSYIARELMQYVSGTRGESQVANFWLLLNLLRVSLEQENDIGRFITLESVTMSDILDELYSFSLTTLADPDAGIQFDWRVQALALETVSLQAAQQTTSFRIELVDALYPVLHFLGSTNARLRDHALTCLNILSNACGYENVGEMIVSNVDYLVNAVGLKLNTFDISPQAPQVLNMMVKLSGPSLLPYLDDLVGSIFAALECFHGYPKLVELLFSTLTAIAEEGVKNPQLAITMGEGKEHRSTRYQPPNVLEVAEILRTMRQRKEAVEDDVSEDFPRRPWKSRPDEHEEPTPEEQEEDLNGNAERPRETNSTDAPPPASNTYDLLLKIATLTQHYLPSASPSLRRSLLTLLNQTVPALAMHENSFLPLINTLWPVLVSRLEDQEAYIISGALDVMSLMCVHAGDFMRSRIVDLWNMLKNLQSRYMIVPGEGQRRGDDLPRQFSLLGLGHQRSPPITSLSRASESSQKLGMQHSEQMGEYYYVETPRRLISESLMRLLCSVVERVEIDEGMFDDALDMLEPVIEKREDVRKALERRNADAVWLRMGKRRGWDGLTANPQGKMEWEWATVPAWWGAA